MVINDLPNMHMHESSFSVWYGLILQQAGGDFKSSNHSYTCNTWRMFDTTATTLSPIPASHNLWDVSRPTLVPNLYLKPTRSQSVGSLLAFGVIDQVIGYSYGVTKSTGGSQSALIRFAFSGYALLAGYAWNWSSYWSCLLSIETYSLTSFMDCIGSFFGDIVQSCMHAG